MTDSYRYSSEYAEECDKRHQDRERKLKETFNYLFRQLEHVAINNEEVRSLLQEYDEEVKRIRGY